MNITVRHNIPYGPDPRQQLDVYTDASQSSDTIVIFWPGGSWKGGNKHIYRFMGRALVRLGYTAVIANYRLYPTVTFPNFIHDGARAAKWVHDNMRPRRLVAMGHSAGAYNAAVLVSDPQYLEAVGLDRSVFSGLVALSGAYDFKPKSALQPIFAGHPRSEWQPVQLVRAPMVPTLLLHGGRDPITAPHNAYSLQRALKAVGGRVELVIYPYFEHFLMLGPFLVPFFWPSVRRTTKHFIDEL